MDKKISNENKDQAVQAWINSQLTSVFLGIKELDIEAAKTVLKHCSKTCLKSWLSFIADHYGWDPVKSNFDDFLEAVNKTAKHFVDGKVSITRQGNIITEEMTLGECCCPLVRIHKLVKPFPGLCLCSANMLKSLYETGSKRPVKVDVIESYNRGDHRCSIRLELL